MKSVPLGAVFYHTDLGQNAVFHNFAIQIALIQYSGRSKPAWAFYSETVKKISKITQMHHHYGSKFLIDSLNSHGFCSSYTEVKKFEMSAAQIKGTDIPVR